MRVDLIDGSLVGETGETLSSMDDREIPEAAARYVHGHVLEIGLGTGITRAALCAAPHVTAVRTVERLQGVVDAWRSNQGSSSVPTSPEDERYRIVIADGLVEIVRATSRTARGCDSVLIDIGRPPAGWSLELGELLDVAGDRLVVICAERNWILPGFAVHLVEGPGPAGLCVFACDRIRERS